MTEMENMAMHEFLQPRNMERYHRNLEADLERYLATIEGHRNSKEFIEALETFHSEKDAFLEVLEENRNAVSGFSGQILSHSGLQCSHTSNPAAAESYE